LFWVGRARPHSDLSSQKSCFLETEETFADNDVIQEIDLKNPSSGTRHVW
jgi:hypothetical protein